MLRLSKLLALGLALLVLAAVPALAVGLAGGAEVDISNITAAANWLLVAVATGFAGWVARWFAHKFKIEADDRVRAYVQKGLELAISFAISRAQASGRLDKTVVRNEVIAKALEYANTHVGGGLARLGKSQAEIAEMIEARLPNPAPAPGPKP